MGRRRAFITVVDSTLCSVFFVKAAVDLEIRIERRALVLVQKEKV